jgi:hypothetical protein
MAKTQKHLWVVQSPNTIAEYDANTFTLKQKITVPDSLPNEVVQGSLAFQTPLSINSLGQILYVPSVNAPESGKVWFWDGKSGVWLDRHGIHTQTPDKTDSKSSTVDSDPVPFLSADGKHFFWFTNTESEYGVLKDPVGDYEPTVETAFRAWQTDLAGGNGKTIAAISIPMCKCETGFCAETCPTIEWYVPKDRQTDFFILTQLIGGESPDFQWTSVFHEVSGQWKDAKLPHPVEDIFDAKDDGAVLVEETSDPYGQVLLTEGAKSTVLFDPFKRFTFSYDSEALDLWFRATEISPNRDLVAWDICLGGNAVRKFATNYWACPDVNNEVDIPFDDGSKPSEAQLAAAQEFLMDLPAVEVISLGTPGKLVTRLPHADLVGWLSDSEVVVLQQNEIEVLDTVTGAVKKSDVRVDKREFVLLR